MTKEERQDLLELKLFLEQTIPEVEIQLINSPLDGTKEDYQFLINKAVMYRETLRQINQQLDDNKSDEHA